LGIVVGSESSQKRTGGTPTYNGVALTIAAGISGGTTIELWYLLNPSTGAAYQISVPNSASINLCIQASSYKAQSGYTSVLDVKSSGSGVSANPSKSVTTTANGDVIVANLYDSYDSAPTAQSGTNLNRTDNDGFSDSNQYKLQVTAGVWASSWTISYSAWLIGVVAFKEYVVSTIDLAGSAAGQSEISGKLTADLILAGSAAGQSGAIGTLNIDTGGQEIRLSGTSGGVSTADGNLTRFQGLSGSAAGQSGASGSLRIGDLVGSAEGRSDAYGRLSTFLPIVIDWSKTKRQAITLIDNIVLSFIPPLKTGNLELIITNTGSYSVLWPVGVQDTEPTVYANAGGSYKNDGKTYVIFDYDEDGLYYGLTQ
jgi:hypothetical protein